jgi:hypothetical protein
MVAVPRRSRLEAELMTFRDDPRPHTPNGTAHRFSVTIPGAVEATTTMVDDALATVARRLGQSASQIASVQLTLVLESIDTPGERQTLPVEVHRDAEGESFTAVAPDFGAWGHGDTVGEAFLDFLTDLTDRSAILMAHREALGPTLQSQAEALERWGANAV